MFEFEIEDLGDVYHVIEKTVDDAGNVLWTIVIRIFAHRHQALEYIKERTA